MGKLEIVCRRPPLVHSGPCSFPCVLSSSLLFWGNGNVTKDRANRIRNFINLKYQILHCRNTWLCQICWHHQETSDWRKFYCNPSKSMWISASSMYNSVRNFGSTSCFALVQFGFLIHLSHWFWNSFCFSIWRYVNHVCYFLMNVKKLTKIALWNFLKF